MEARAVARFVRVSPRKARMVIDLIRDKDLAEAQQILDYTPKAAAYVVSKVLNSAAANAENNFGLEPEDLFVSRCFVDEGPTLKRFRPRALGRATRIDKRTSHITVVLAEKETGKPLTRRQRRRRAAIRKEAAREEPAVEEEEEKEEKEKQKPKEKGAGEGKPAARKAAKAKKPAKPPARKAEKKPAKKAPARKAAKAKKKPAAKKPQARKAAKAKKKPAAKKPAAKKKANEATGESKPGETGEEKGD